MGTSSDEKRAWKDWGIRMFRQWQRGWAYVAKDSEGVRREGGVRGEMREL